MNLYRSTEQGFAAIAAIFLVVVLAALGGFMLTFSNTQQLTSTQDLQGTRAYWAARAGLEWAVGSIAAQPSATADCLAASTPLPGGVGATFDGGFTVTVTCTRTLYSEGGEERKIFQFTSVAQTAGAVGSVGYVERSLSASMEQ
jgi:MSHA biogenesis protein MshP